MSSSPPKNASVRPSLAPTPPAPNPTPLPDAAMPNSTSTPNPVNPSTEDEPTAANTPTTDSGAGSGAPDDPGPLHLHTEPPTALTPVPSPTAETNLQAATAIQFSITRNNPVTSAGSAPAGKKTGPTRAQGKDAEAEAEEEAEAEDASDGEESQKKRKGPKPWAVGRVEKFLLTYMHQYQTEIVSNQKKAQSFYNTVLKDLMMTHGWGMFFVFLVAHEVELDPARNLPLEPDDPGSAPSIQRRLAVPDPLTKKWISGLSKENFKLLKSLYNLGPGSDWTPEIWKACRIRLAAWFPYRHNRLTKADVNAAALNAISRQFATLTGLYIDIPRKPQPIQEYTRRFWPTYIGPIFRAEWELMCARLKTEGKEVPKKISVEDRNKVVRRFWNQEPDEVQQALKDEIERDHKAAMHEYEEKMKNVPEVGKMYTWTRQQAYSLLQPLATAIGMRFGSVVSIMIAAPLMEDGGVDTIHVTSGETIDAAPRKWERYDAMSVDAATAAFTQFADQCFHAQARKTRADALASASLDLFREPQDEPKDEGEPEPEMTLLNENDDLFGNLPAAPPVAGSASAPSLSGSAHATSATPPALATSSSSQALTATTPQSSFPAVAIAAQPSSTSNVSQDASAHEKSLDNLLQMEIEEPIDDINMPSPSLSTPVQVHAPPNPTSRPRPRPLKKASRDTQQAMPPSDLPPTLSTPTTTSGQNTPSPELLPPSIPPSTTTLATESVRPSTSFTSPSVDNALAPGTTTLSIPAPPPPLSSVLAPSVSSAPPLPAPHIVPPSASSTAPPSSATPSPSASVPPSLVSSDPTPPPPATPTSLTSPDITAAVTPPNAPATSQPPESSPELGTAPPPLDPPGLSPFLPTPAAAPTPSSSSQRPVRSFMAIKEEGLREWYKEAFEYMEKAKLGSTFERLIDKFYEFEESKDFEPTPGGFPKKDRPQALTDWIAGARRWNDTQWRRIKNVQAFGKQFQMWWASFQPDGRGHDEDGRFKQGGLNEVDWEPLEIVGKNGLWLAIAGLCFWGIAFQSESDRLLSDEWHYSVTDVTWVLHQLMCPSRQLAAPAPHAHADSEVMEQPSVRRQKRKIARATSDDEDDGVATRSSKRLRQGKDREEEGPSRATRSSAKTSSRSRR